MNACMCAPLRAALTAVGLSLPLLLGGCASPVIDLADGGAVEPPHSNGPATSTHGKQNVTLSEPTIVFQQTLTMREAINRSLKHSPMLKIAALEIDVKDAAAFQASRRPNPSLGFEFENFAGTGDLRGAKAAEETLSLTQVIELGGKRTKRLREAELDTATAAWDFEAVRMRVVRETAEAFVDVLAIQEAIASASRASRIAHDLEVEVKARVNAGEVSPVEIERTRPIVAKSLANLRAVKARHEPAKRRLASIWGQTRAGFGRVSGKFSYNSAIPPLDLVLKRIERNAEIVRWTSEIARRNATVNLELAKSVPDITLGAGIRHLNETNATALLATASIGLPIFNRNRGNIRAAKTRTLQGMHERDASLASLRAVLLVAYEEVASAAAEVRGLADEVVPSAKAAFRAMQTSFRAGAVELISVLDARRVLNQAEIDLVLAQAKFEKAKIRIESLIGRLA